MALLISSAALFLLAHLLTSDGRTPETASGTVTAKWSANLRPTIGSAPLGQMFGRKRERQGLPQTSLWFLDDGTIVATFVTQERANPSLSSRDSSDPNQPLRLRAIFLDADTGRITSTQAWPSVSRLARIVAADKGKFVTQSGTTLTLYSSDAKELKKLSLPSPPQNLNGWHAHPSPTGKSILFATGDLMATSPKPWIWVDTNTLDVVRSWQEVQTGWMEISDSAIAMTACTIRLYRCEPHVEIRGIATEWKTIADIEKTQGAGVQFVNQNMLFLSGSPWKLLQTDGRIVLTDADPKGGAAVSSAGGKRFIVPFFKLVGRVEALDIGGHGDLKTISVYDAPFHERSYKLEVKGPKIRSISDKSVAQLALSPDGSKLSVLYEESVYFFQLPPPSTEHIDTGSVKNGNSPAPDPPKPKPQFHWSDP